MKFEPLVFIRIAQRNGIKLTRIDDHLCVRNAPAIWTPILRRYKRKLLKHLPDDEVKGLQVDLFNDLQ